MVRLPSEPTPETIVIDSLPSSSSRSKYSKLGLSSDVAFRLKYPVVDVLTTPNSSYVPGSVIILTIAAFVSGSLTLIPNLPPRMSVTSSPVSEMSSSLSISIESVRVVVDTE